MIRGKKTYITAAAAAFTALGGWLSGDLASAEAVQLVFTALMAAGLRHGIISK